MQTVPELDKVGIRVNVEDSSAMTFRNNNSNKDDFTSMQHIYNNV